jgi:hypothetical protein
MSQPHFEGSVKSPLTLLKMGLGSPLGLSKTQNSIVRVKTPCIEVFCRNPTLAKCGGEAQHLEKLEVGSLPGLPNVQSSTARPKTPRIGVFLVSLERP